MAPAPQTAAYRIQTVQDLTKTSFPLFSPASASWTTASLQVLRGLATTSTHANELQPACARDFVSYHTPGRDGQIKATLDVA